MNKILTIIKKESVMLISLLLAVISMFFISPSADYINYIDFRTLALLFCLMTVMTGFNRIGLFKILAESLLEKIRTVRGLVLILMLLCFFSSMIITNDVALITFVPFTITVLKLAGQKKKMILTVSLETAAANLGSMLTPIGNPQNLYLYSAYDMKITDFFSAILPYAVLSLVILLIIAFLSGKAEIKLGNYGERLFINSKLMILYLVLFGVSLLGVFRILDFRVLLIVTVISVLLFDIKSIVKVDYSLLLTFVFLFIFIGNLGRMPGINEWLSSIVKENEVIIGVFTSQVFSNVPAAILLSEFTQNAQSLLIGVNLGGLGTLIASMASLISFKYIQKEDIKKSEYIFMFTVINIVLLTLNLLLWYIIK